MPPPLPFPLPLHVGTDICRISRIAHLLRSPHCRRFVRRVLSPEELARAKPVVHEAMRAASERAIGDVIAKAFVKDGTVTEGGEEQKSEKEEAEEGDREVVVRRAAEFMAGRFAAKEAAIKAHPHLKLGFHDILILTPSHAAKLTGGELMQSSGSSAPVALIKAPKRGNHRDQMARVSISHDGAYSTAVCIGFEAGPEGEGKADGEGESRKGWLHRISSLWS